MLREEGIEGRVAGGGEVVKAVVAARIGEEGDVQRSGGGFSESTEGKSSLR